MGEAGGVVGGVEVIFGLPCRVGLAIIFDFRFFDATMIAWYDRRLPDSLSKLCMRGSSVAVEIVTSFPKQQLPLLQSRTMPAEVARPEECNYHL